MVFYMVGCDYIIIKHFSKIVTEPQFYKCGTREGFITA